MQLVARMVDGVEYMGWNGIPTEAKWLYAIYITCRIVGRLAIPIFAYMLVEGFRHTHSVKNYALRLGLFALLVFTLGLADVGCTGKMGRCQYLSSVVEGGCYMGRSGYTSNSTFLWPRCSAYDRVPASSCLLSCPFADFSHNREIDLIAFSEIRPRKIKHHTKVASNAGCS